MLTYNFELADVEMIINSTARQLAINSFLETKRMKSRKPHTNSHNKKKGVIRATIGSSCIIFIFEHGKNHSLRKIAIWLWQALNRETWTTPSSQQLSNVDETAPSSRFEPALHQAWDWAKYLHVHAWNCIK